MDFKKLNWELEKFLEDTPLRDVESPEELQRAQTYLNNSPDNTPIKQAYNKEQELRRKYEKDIQKFLQWNAEIIAIVEKYGRQTGTYVFQLDRLPKIGINIKGNLTSSRYNDVIEDYIDYIYVQFAKPYPYLIMGNDTHRYGVETITLGRDIIDHVRNDLTIFMEMRNSLVEKFNISKKELRSLLDNLVEREPKLLKPISNFVFDYYWAN